MKKPPTAPSVAEFYHQSTKYFPENLSDFTPDPAAKPPPFKSYLSERSVDLKPFLKEALEMQPVTAASPSPFTSKRGAIGGLSRLLYHTGGITGVLESSGGPHYFRAAPSAGALYPTDIYVVSREIQGLPDGIHYYSVLNHALIPVWEGDYGMDVEEFCFRHAAAIRAKAFLVFTGIFQRSAWRYRERAYRRILLDTGHLLGNTVLYASLEGLRAVVIGGFFDAAMNDLLFLDAKEEAVLLVAPLLEEKELKNVPINSPFPFPSLRSPHADVLAADEGLMRLLHRQSGIIPDERLVNQVPTIPYLPDGAFHARPRPSARGNEKGGPEKGSAREAPARSVWSFEHEEFSTIPALGPVIRRRRSTRRFEPRPISLENLGRILRFGYEPARKYWRMGKGLPLQDCIFTDPTLLATYLVVLRVEGLPPGIYRFDAESFELELLRQGFFQEELFNLTLRQELGRDCAAALIHAADLSRCIRRYGDRAYRYLHLDAGHIGERVNLAAVEVEVGVSGIGGFFDEEVNELLGLPASMIVAYITVLGTPASSSSKSE
ncbi:MAG: SagB/ThcOx family dehydrogenase [Planctomycetes bacterium]|nr:SagB/ThcOx family dehydrogenase [Planctomycetota bacterium]